MDTNQYFSFSRLGMVMKRDWMENWKFNLRFFLAVFLAYLAAYLFFMNVFADDSHREVDSYIVSHYVGFAAINSFSLLLFAAEMMRNMRTKESRLSNLMLPASSLEKFLARALIVTFGGTLMIILASLLAELVHWTFIPFFDAFPDKFKVWIWGGKGLKIGPLGLHLGEYSFVKGITSMMYGLWWHSLFILGGNFFRKSPFSKMITIMVLLGTTLSFVANLLDVGEVWNLLRPFMAFIQHSSSEMLDVLAVVVFSCLTALNWWLSYKLFTRRQVIEPKFRLL